MKKFNWIAVLGLVAIAAVPMAQAQSHFNLSSDWVLGDGVYVVVQDDDENKVLFTAALDGTDPKHAWVGQDFGDEYTIRADVRIDSWEDASDPSRGGLVIRVQPDGSGGGAETDDRGVNLLFHNDVNRVQFLNDMVGWGPEVEFAWEIRTWYTVEITTSGTIMSGKITKTDDDSVTVDLAEWEIPSADGRPGGLVGVTANTGAGQCVSFDNFEVIVGGEVVFSDDFETPGDPMPQISGMDGWVAGEAGLYIQQDGVLYGIATNGVDPKHAWFDQELTTGGRITADVKMMTWEDHDFSRAGLALHTQPEGLGGGRPAENRAMNLLYHNNADTVQFLNDMRAWGSSEVYTWATNEWYSFDFSSDGVTVSGSITNAGDEADSIALAPWEFDTDQNRVDGFAGVTASTRGGQISAWRNIEIYDIDGNLVYTNNPETPISEWSLFN